MVGENNYRLLAAKWNGVNSLLVCPQPDVQKGMFFCVFFKKQLCVFTFLVNIYLYIYSFFCLLTYACMHTHTQAHAICEF